MSEQVQLRFVAKPDDVGVYSNVAQVTSSPWDFTIDFYSANPAEMTPTGLTAQANLVARVKVPTNVIFQLAKAIATTVDAHEKTYGPISSGGPIGFDEPPTD